MRKLVIAAVCLLLGSLTISGPASASAVVTVAAAKSQPVITLAVTPVRPHAGGSYVVTGGIRQPSGSGSVGLAARLTLTGPGYSSTFTVGSTGTFHHAVTHALPGTWTATFAGDATHLPARGSVTFTTYPNATRIVSYDVGPEPAYRNGALDFHGYLQRYSPTLHRWVGYAGQRIVVTRSSPSGYATARTTTSTGYFGGLIRGKGVIVTATWVASFAGSFSGSTPVNQAVVGPGDRVDTHTAPIKISRVYYDPPGADATNINGEHIMLLNIGDRTANLNGWSVRPRVGPYVFTFTTDVYLQPGQNVTIFSGKGRRTAVHFFWGTHASIWPNGGGTADLRNDLGVVADSCTWGRGPGYTSC